MKNVRIIALHLAYGGIEKAIISTANLLADRYNVEIISVYNMPGGPAFPLDERVKVRYLLTDIPNKDEWKAAVKAKNPVAFIRESAKSVKILRDKKQAVIDTVKSIHDGVIITTRNEDNVVLSEYGDKNVLKIAQLHQDHGFEKKLVNDFEKHYGNIDVFTLLTPGLAEEVKKIMRNNTHTKIMCVPNFLESFPENVKLDEKENTVLAAGRLDPVKGFDRLIRCFAMVSDQAPDWKLKIAGAGDEREKLERIIDELKLSEKVSLLGKLDAEGIENEMRKASVFAMSSHSEGFPFVLLEAKSCGLPTVAFDVRVGPAAVLKDGEDGFLVKDDDSEAYSQKLLQLISSKELRDKMAQKAMENVREFSSQRLYKIWTDIIGD